MNLLLVGNGGREHAIASAIMRSNPETKIFNAGSAVNPGLALLCADCEALNMTDFDTILRYGQKHECNLAVIGPDDPIGNGLTDFLEANDIRTFAPTQKNAQLEASKAFTRELVAKTDLNCQPAFKNCVHIDEFKAFFDKLDGKIVVKADGLMGGKGVLVEGDHFNEYDEAKDFAEASIAKFGQVVAEEKLIGVEFSLISITDGTTFLHCPAVQDHKRAFEGDTGPNTGGMGVISGPNGQLPFLTDADTEDAKFLTEQIISALQKETNQPYKGVVFGGFMKTAKGVKLIEYNCRFGDPEALNLLTLLETPLLDVIIKTVEGNLAEIEALSFAPYASVCKYLCPEGYPTNSVKNVPVIVKNDKPEGAKVYFASVGKEKGQLLLKGSRAIGVVGFGQGFEAANANCEKAMAGFEGPLFYRKDIGTAEMLQTRIDMAENL